MAKQKKYSIEWLSSRLKSSQEFMWSITQDFPGIHDKMMCEKPDRNADGTIDLDKLEDKTLPSFIRKTPKQYIQKIPEFVVDAQNSNKAEDLTYEYILKRYILGTGSDGYNTLQNHWITATNAMTYGSCAVAQLPVLNDRGELTVSYEIIQWRDLYPEAYSKNINLANWCIFRMRKTEDDIEGIIENAGKNSGWNIKALKEILETGRGSFSYTLESEASQEQQDTDQGLYEMFVYTDTKKIIFFSDKNQTILRTLDNISGVKLVDGLIIDPNGVAFFGNSLIDLGYEAQQQLTALWRALVKIYVYNADPTLLVKGSALDEKTFKLTTGNRIFLKDAEGDVVPINLNTSILSVFTDLVRLAQAKLMSCLPASTDTSISSEVGDYSYSKTQAGVNDQVRREGVEMNYYRKNYEAFVETHYENALNIWLAEKAHADKAQKKTSRIELDEEYANKIGEVDPEYIVAGRFVNFTYDPKRKIRLNVNFDSSRSEVKEENLKHLTSFMASISEVIKTNENIAAAFDEIMPSILKAMVRNSELEDSAEIIKVIDDALKERKQLAMEQLALSEGVQNV